MDKKQLIASYFLNTLSDEDQISFNTLYENDGEFKKNVEFEKSVQRAIVINEHAKIKSQLRGFENKNEILSSKSRWWMVAASVVFLVLAGLFFKDSKATPHALFDTYYQPAKNIVHPIVRNTLNDNALTKAFVAYQKKDYQNAQSLFGALYKDTKVSSLLFYEGISLLEIDEVTEAIKKFEQHKQFSDNVTRMTDWYLALAHIKNNDVQKAKPILEHIISDKNAYKSDVAKKLLKKL